MLELPVSSDSLVTISCEDVSVCTAGEGSAASTANEGVAGIVYGYYKTNILGKNYRPGLFYE